MHANNSNRDVLVDAAIAGGAAVAGLLTGTAIGVVRADPVAFAYGAAAAFLTGFMGSLVAAARRGHVQEPPAP